MHATVRASVVTACLCVATSASAQMPADSPTARARQLLAATRSGQEGEVACDGLDAAVARSLVDLGDRTRANAPERATVAFRLAERAARCADAAALTGLALNDLSEVLFARGQFQAALAAAEESVRIHERLHDAAALAEAWNNVGNVHWWLEVDDMRQALDDYHRSLDLWTTAADRKGQARVLNNLGNVYRFLGQFDTALHYFTRSLQTLEDLGDRRRAAVVTDNIGLIYFWRGEFATALTYSRRALQMQQDAANRAGEAKSLDSLGNIYRALGAYREALQSFRQALEIRSLLDDRAGVMETSHNIGLVHFSQGDYQLAIDAYKRALDLNRRWALHDESFVAEALRNIGAAAWRLGQFERAEADFRESLAIAERKHSLALEGDLLHDLGQAELRRGRVPQAARFFDRALTLRREIGDQAGITESLTTLASARLAAGQPAPARDLAQEATDNALTHDQRELLWQAQTVVGVASRRLGRIAVARKALLDAIVSIERLSAEVVDRESLRQQFFEDKLSPYHELIALCLAEGSFGEAFEMAERSKARVLAELIRGHTSDESGILTPGEVQEQTRLQGVLFSLNRQIESQLAEPPTDVRRVPALEAERRAARDGLAAFEASLAARHPELAAVRGQVAPLTLEQASRMLTDRETAIIEYVVADRQLFAFMVTRDGRHIAVDGHVIDIGVSALASRAERFRQRVGARDFGVTEDARALYDTLLAPFQDRLIGKSRLIVVPDGALWNVPFQALRGPQGYVIETAEVSYVPSLTVLREILTLPRPAGPPTLLAMAPSSVTPGPVQDPDPLLDAARQVQLIGDIYGPDRSRVYLGNKATEGRFKAVAPDYTILHLATHGILDETSPLYSSLTLERDAAAPDDDGRLEAWEIMRLKLHADLVVLAACDTGRGRIAPGEGVIGTMWALFAAGARSMVVSQFPVESRSATALLVAFHRHLAGGTGSKSAQLRRAAIELLHTARYAHPYYWAGFILVGDSD
jgi:CHAT domain-containing protein/tetratricopeptide (TPR) repeat protein